MKAEFLRKDQSGQAVIEYVLLLAIVVTLFFILLSGLSSLRVGEKLMEPLTVQFARTYQHGHPKAQGFDDGGPIHHPRVVEGENFRIFLNPGSK